MQPKLQLNGDTLNDYLTHLESSGYSSSAQHAKLCRLQVEIEYLTIGGSEVEVVRAGQVFSVGEELHKQSGKAVWARKRNMLEDREKGNEELGKVEEFFREEVSSLIKQAVKGDTRSRCGLTLWLTGVLLC